MRGEDRAKIFQRLKQGATNAILQDRRLTSSASRIGAFINDHVNAERCYAWPPVEYIADKLGVGTRTVKRALPQLEGLDGGVRYFAVLRDGRNNRYVPMWVRELAKTGDKIAGGMAREIERLGFSTGAKLAPIGGDRGHSVRDRCQIGPRIGAKLAPYPSTDPSIDPAPSAAGEGAAAGARNVQPQLPLIRTIGSQPKAEPSRQALENEAHRRLDDALRLLGPGEHGAAVVWITPERERRFLDVEIANAGAGVALMLAEWRAGRGGTAEPERKLA